MENDLKKSWNLIFQLLWQPCLKVNFLKILLKNLFNFLFFTKNLNFIGVFLKR